MIEFEKQLHLNPQITIFAHVRMIKIKNDEYS